MAPPFSLFGDGETPQQKYARLGSAYTRTNEVNNSKVLTVEQTQSTSQQTPPGPIPYGQPRSRTIVYDYTKLQQDVKVKAYLDAKAEGKTEEQAQNISASAGNLAGAEAMAADANNEGIVGNSSAVASSDAGFGAPTEDAGESSGFITSAKINASGPTNQGIKPRPNFLDQFASYTYALSWYMITPEQKKALKATSVIDVSGWSLLMQSGGAGQQEKAAGQTGMGNTFSVSGSSGRNKYFTLDYYMDNLIIESAFNNIAMSTVSELSFSVVEPNGITLLKNLAHAAMDMYKDSGVSAKDAFYVMAIRFYGYDIQGNLSSINGGSNSGHAITKYFPFNISNIEFKAANRAVEYLIKGVPLNDIIGKSSALGSIPENFQLVGETIDDILNGKQTNTATPVESADRGASNAPAPPAEVKPPTETSRLVDPLTTAVDIQFGA